MQFFVKIVCSCLKGDSMELLCPVCNGFQTVNKPCPSSGNAMEDGGPVDGYSDPYAPYMEAGIESYCVHLIYCPVCHYDFRIAWHLVAI